jgi:hypothetical protein
MKLIEIYDGTIFHAQMVKDLLEIEGIVSSLKNEITATRGGDLWSPAGGVKVIISDLDYDRAKKIIDEFEKSQSEN